MFVGFDGRLCLLFGAPVLTNRRIYTDRLLSFSDLSHRSEMCRSALVIRCGHASCSTISDRLRPEIGASIFARKGHPTRNGHARRHHVMMQHNKWLAAMQLARDSTRLLAPQHKLAGRASWHLVCQVIGLSLSLLSAHACDNQTQRVFLQTTPRSVLNTICSGAD